MSNVHTDYAAGHMAGVNISGKSQSASKQQADSKSVQGTGTQKGTQTAQTTPVGNAAWQDMEQKAMDAFTKNLGMQADSVQGKPGRSSGSSHAGIAEEPSITIAPSEAPQQGAKVSSPDSVDGQASSPGFINLSIPGIPGGMKLPMDGPLLLAAVQNKLSNDFVKELRDVLEADKKQQRETHDKRVKKLGAALKKAQAAKHKSLFSKIFGWVAAAVTAIVGAVLTVLAPPLGVAILISAAVAIAVQALQQTGELQKFAKVMGKAMKGMFDAFGVKAPWDEKAGEIFAQVLVAAVVIAVDVVTMVATGGATAEKMATDLALKIIKIIKVTAQITQSAATLASTGLGVSASVDQYHSSMDEADGLKMEALLSYLNAQDTIVSGAIQESYQAESAMYQSMGDMLQIHQDAADELVRKMRPSAA